MDLINIKHTYFDLFYKSIRIFFIFGRCFNIIPYVIELPDTKVSEIKKSFNKISYALIVQCIVSTFIICSVAISTHYQHIEFDTTMGFLTRLLYMGEYFFGIFNMILIMYGCIYQRNNYTKYILKLNEMDLKLVKYKIKVDFKFINLYFKFYLVIYSVFFLLVLLIDLMYNRYDVKSFFRSSTVYTVPNIISILGLTQYSGIFYYIRIKYQQINKHLAKISKMQSSFDYGIPKKNFVSVVGALKSSVNEDSTFLLNTLRIIHADLSALCKEISNSFGILIISTLVTSFVVLSIQLYAIYKTVEGYSGDDFYLIIYTILWIVLHGGKICIILLASDGVTSEVCRLFFSS